MNTTQNLIYRNMQSLVCRESNKCFDMAQSAETTQERQELMQSRERIEKSWLLVSNVIMSNEGLASMTEALKAIAGDSDEFRFVMIEARQQIKWAQGE